MTTVVIGTNRFVDCQTIVAFDGEPLLAITDAPLRVRLRTPDGNPSKRDVDIDSRSGATLAPPLRIVVSPDFVGVYWDVHALVLASRVEGDLVHAFVDLRPVGLAIYVDGDALRVGDGVFASNTISAAIAIAIGGPRSNAAE